MAERVIVVGGGAAGMTAALAVANAGGKVTLITNAIGGGSSPWAQGGVAAAIGADDSPEQHLRDTLACGGGLVDEEAARLMAEEAAARIADLIAAGVPFDREPDGSLALGLEGGHHRRRIIHAGGGATGWHIVRALANVVLATAEISVLEGPTVAALQVKAGRVTGVELRWPDGIDGVLEGPVVLATGGCAGLYGRSTNPETVNGRGIALAWQAGAALADLEFVQFHPTALDLPVAAMGHKALLLTEALRGEGAYLLDAHGRRFLTAGPLAHPLAELAPRDVVARAIHYARQDGPVFLSLRHLDPDHVRARFPNLVSLLASIGLDLATDLLPVAPAAHYLMGGVWSDRNGASTVPGLYVAGEVACTGVHGANRLASNSLLECLVFGRRAGLAALEGVAPSGFEEALNRGYELDAHPPAPPEQGVSGEALGALLDSNLGVIRNEAGLSEALARLAEDEAGVVARRIALGAWLRRESRGAHYRNDFPETVERWRGRIIQQRGRAPHFAPVRAPVAAAERP
ncbi:MAG: FAD-dependent oxidoreductase [Chloroflexota bacterium]|nr:FAD-dependent oxidoreductase [Dehalococcoidia bacterium]MDW8252973.1 FAD-dependent oxidoreductase [Chloroflexota bacterium]